MVDGGFWLFDGIWLTWHISCVHNAIAIVNTTAIIRPIKGKQSVIGIWRMLVLKLRGSRINNDILAT